MKDKVFLSYTTVAPMREASYKAVRQFVDEFYEIGPPEVLYKYDPMSEELANQAAQLLNCDPEEITYTKNTTEGIIIASESLPLDRGDEILVLANEYPANLLPWMKKRKDGISVTIVPGMDNDKAFADLLSKIGPRTKVIAMSYGQCYDGYIANLPLLSSICREEGIFLVIDAAQTVGIRKIDLKKTPVTSLSAGGQKYLQAGMGTGLLYVNKEVMPKLRDYKVGIRSMDHFDENFYVLKDTAARFQDGTQNLYGIVSMIAALKEINETGIENIEKKNLELLAEIKSVLRKYNIPFIDNGDQQGNIVAMTVDDYQGLFEYLKDKGVYIKPIKNVARLSFIHTTPIEDVEKMAKLTRDWLDSKA